MTTEPSQHVYEPEKQFSWRPPRAAGPWEQMVKVLHTAYVAREPISVTWLNHHSARGALDEPATNRVDIVGIDGKLLQFLVGGEHRTSADLVVPALLPRLTDGRVVIIGGSAETLAPRRSAVEELLPPSSHVVLALDGYHELPDLPALASLLADVDANVVIVALGAGLQERYAVGAKDALSGGGLAITCGGLLDQLLVESYYPSWAYPLRLNWLVRLAREPQRLWRRYSLEAMWAVANGKLLRRRVRAIPGLWA
jgi:beta-1,4-glucosyltransferase